MFVQEYYKVKTCYKFSTDILVNKFGHSMKTPSLLQDMEYIELTKFFKLTTIKVPILNSITQKRESR